MVRFVSSEKFIQFFSSSALRPQPIQILSVLSVQILTQGDCSMVKLLFHVKFLKFSGEFGLDESQLARQRTALNCF
jgi:hypothetical protein